MIYSEHDLYDLLDELLASQGGEWWDGFYENRAKPIPFFVNKPDENLFEWVTSGQVSPGRMLDIGCGNGRNCLYLSKHGFQAEGVDYSQTAIDWANELATEAGQTIQLHCKSVFDLNLDPESCDFIYDSGCFHHLPPHHRKSYCELVAMALKPGGQFGLTCFRPEGGSGLTDLEVYEKRSMGGGLGYTEIQLKEIWSRVLEIQEIRPMQKHDHNSDRFGEDFLWVMLAKKF
jgi:SAM-dependent methyltransferase